MVKSPEQLDPIVDMFASQEFLKGYGEAIQRFVSPEFFEKAQTIVFSRQADGNGIFNLKFFGKKGKDKEGKPTEGGLTPEEHLQVNVPSTVFPGGRKARDAYIAKLRENHKGEERARRQIDIYDSNSEYHTKFIAWRDALRAGDKRTINELEKWFKDNGYDDLT